MENLSIAAVNDTYFVPKVEFDAETGICSIEGESFLEQTTDFYKKLSDWITEFLVNSDKKLTLNVKLIYFNTSSSRALLNLFKLLKDEKDNHQKDIEVNWYFPDPDDEELEMEGEDFMNDSGLEINLVSYELED